MPSVFAFSELARYAAHVLGALIVAVVIGGLLLAIVAIRRVMRDRDRQAWDRTLS